jgi:RHS repeat-associated protein
MRYEKKVTQFGQVIDFRHYVYDEESRLLEEYEQTNGAPILIGRYYYADSDAPDAADLFNPSTGKLARYYYLKDNMESVVAVADTNGTVVERAWYDPFGQPQIELRDTQSPRLENVTLAPDGVSLLIAMSESIGAPKTDPGAGGGIVLWPALPTNLLTISANSTNYAGTLTLLPAQAGYAPYSVFQFTPGQPLPEPPSSLISWWPADNGASDVAGGHNGSLQGGATTGPGLINQAFILNGTNAYVSIPDTSALNVSSNDFSVTLWVNFTNTTGEQVLIEKWIESSRSGWSLIKMPDNSLELALGDGAGNEVDITTGVVPNLTTNWVHFGIRRQANTFTIFTNGVAAGSGTDTADLDAATPLLFGSRQGTSFFLHGSIDEVALYGSALTDGQMAAVAAGVSIPGPITITVTPGVVVDDWGNSNVGQTISFQVNTQPGTVYYDAEPAVATAATPLARSAIGSPFLFHGEYFDYDTGLIYLRARFYDPYSGMFMEPDPGGYGDSVNLYAGMGNNPVGYRDPSGLVEINSGSVGKADDIMAELNAMKVGTRSAATEQRAVQEVERVGHLPNSRARIEVLSGTAEPTLKTPLCMNASAMMSHDERLAAERFQQEKFNLANQNNAHDWASLNRNGEMAAVQQNRIIMNPWSTRADEGWDATRRAFNVEPKPGWFDVVIHGSGTGVWLNHEKFTPDQLKFILENHPGYVKGTPIRLLSCNTGRYVNGFAKSLAVKMGVQVEAPTGILRMESGGMGVRETALKILDDNNMPTGRFRLFSSDPLDFSEPRGVTTHVNNTP